MQPQTHEVSSNPGESKGNPKVSFGLSKEAQAVVEHIVQGKCKDSIIQFTVDNETSLISPKTSLPFDGCSRADRVERVLSLAKKEGASLFIFRMDLRSNTPEWAMLAWAPEGSVPYAQRMFYFTALSWFSRTLVNARPVHEFYVKCEHEMPSFHWS
ncbi:uncharacterized protein LOC34618248 [Cyclospora cayetanensis]|uniref:Uncharacterized protein LOC34618248 n=1 Tax=Cyclospora cayetanensis TaxID=88456 RepID=A0A6P6S0Y7_9EIME|nr:uncharacterized protein LOC34618248 [Cyclospora cayetanensis]